MSKRSTRNPNEVRMSFGEHLEELRSCLIKALAGILLATVLCLMAAQHIFSFIMRPAYAVLDAHGQDTALQSLSPPDSFLLYIKVAMLSGVIVSSPWVFWQFWRFVASGLYDKERRYVRAAILPSIGLFLLGVTFMYYIVLPIVLNFFASFNQQFPVPDWPLSPLEKRLLGAGEPAAEIEGPSPLEIPVLNGDPAAPQPGALWFNQHQKRLKLRSADGTYEVRLRSTAHITAITNQYSVDFYASFVLRLSLAFGVAFQVPIVVICLALTGVVPRQQLCSSRRYVILIFVIAAAVLTPPDVVSQLLLAIPMLLLYEVGLLIAGVLERRQAAQADQRT